MNITVTITAAPELLSAIERIADNLAPKSTVAPVSAPTPTTEAPVEKEPVAEAKKPAATMPKPSVNGKQITLEKVREKVQEKSQAGKRDSIKEILKEFGAEKVTALQEDQYANFYSKVEAL